MLPRELMAAEWLETDGLGGFASGTVGGVRTRRYHGVLLCARTPPTRRVILVNGFDAWVERGGQAYGISAQAYLPDVVHPDNSGRLVAFTHEPWPRWHYRLEDGTELEQELWMCHHRPVTVIMWRLLTPGITATLTVRPYLSGRDLHGTHQRNANFRFATEIDGERLAWRPYAGVPTTCARFNGTYTQDAYWYQNFLYEEERLRGLLCNEDLGSPGSFSFALGPDDATLILGAGIDDRDPIPRNQDALSLARVLRRLEEERRSAFPTPLERAADAYVVARGKGKTIIAGYPWFDDWGRDTFIAMRGLCLATRRFELARDILVEWAAHVSEGMLPNRFTEGEEQPAYNSVDASLWYVIAVHDYLAAMQAAGSPVPEEDLAVLHGAVEAILTGYRDGTRYGIKLDEDGLLRAGERGSQLTWMDAKVGDWVVTPRVGKPVEVQALWLNALHFAGARNPAWLELYAKGLAAFRARFWHEAGGYLCDVVDVEHRPGTADTTLRPNQILAVGGLPLPLLEGDLARKVVDAVESRLLTPLGLRSLDPADQGFQRHYEGGVGERDGAYHQGTVWLWLIGPFVEAWLRVRGNTATARQEARTRFLPPLEAHLSQAGLGHLSEIADAVEPHTPRGCPFQAWSMGEMLRLKLHLLRDEPPAAP